MITITIYRTGVTTPILSEKPNESSSIKQSIMGDYFLTLQFDLNIMIDLRIGDYCDLFGVRYYIHSTKIPNVVKKSTYHYQYDLQMMSSQYLLRNALYLFLGDDNTLKESEFSLFGTADDFINLLIKNANRTGITWIKGGVVETEYKNLTFSNVDCLAALGTLADAFATEWYVDGTTIHLAKKLNAVPFIFMYGQEKGMYDITRKPADSSTIVTRLYAFGGTQNLPPNYRNGATTLLLPAVSDPKLVSDITYTVTNNGGLETIVFNWTAPTDAAVTGVTIFYRLSNGNAGAYTYDTGGKISPRSLTDIPSGIYEVGFRSELSGGGTISTATIIITSFSSPYAVLPGAAQPYIQYNTNLYGIIEQSINFDDIYPHRTGIVTGVDALNPFIFYDTNIDFDINAQLLPGTAAKVVFNTGQLSGYTFDIADGGYDNGTKQVTILKNKDEKALDIPSNLFKPAIGDEYVLVDISMPQSYIDAAETALLQKAQDYLNTFSSPVYAYSVDCDPKYFRERKINLSYGDVVTIVDQELNINRAIRILSVTKLLTDEYNYQIELGETVATGTIQKIQSSLSGNSNSINNINSAIQNNKLLGGNTQVGNLTVQQGTLILPDIPTASDTSGMQVLYIDANGKVWKG